MARKRGNHRQSDMNVEHSGNRRERNREGRRPRLGEVGWLTVMLCGRHRQPRTDTNSVDSAGHPKLFPSQSPESASLRGCSALFLRSLHIPHILYAQLRRNNQGSKLGHSRTAVPHTARIACSNRLPPESQAGRPQTRAVCRPSDPRSPQDRKRR